MSLIVIRRVTFGLHQSHARGQDYKPCRVPFADVQYRRPFRRGQRQLL